ncbi:MAG: TrkH family potassium uptake protein [Eggerthellaceae bacterium]|nr:TrkH family potassium uptake protein [Eggerthellaceae bacterium]
MWHRFTFSDVRTICHYLGVLILFSTLIYVLPFITALVLREWEPAARYLSAIAICLVIGSLLRFMRVRPARLNRQQALVVTGLAWIILAWFASIPLFGSGHYATYLDALFDGVSGLTTTGATAIVDLDHLSNADNMFRFMMHLLGGLGLVVVALALGLFGKSGGTTMYASEGRSEHVIPNVVETARFIFRIAIGFIIVAAVILSIINSVKGMVPVRAVLHGFWVSISGFITGGFAPMSDSITYYHSTVVEIILMVLMIMGAINFALHLEAWKGRVEPFFKDFETRTMIIWVLAMLVVLTASLSSSGQFTDLPALLRRGLFMVVSAFTTTGFQNITGNQLATVFSSGALLTLGIIMAVGGGGGSTAGGIKFSRIGLILKSVVATVKQTLAPDSARTVVTYNHLGRQNLNEGAVKEAMTVFMLFVVTYLAGALVGIAYGYPAPEAFFQSIAMTSNGGLSVLVGPGMPVGLELFYMLQMWAGRLEFVTLLALIVQIVVSFVPRGLRKAVAARAAAADDGSRGLDEGDAL